jgi:ATP-dependent Clp protease ATP-binding subunit ClpX
VLSVAVHNHYKRLNHAGKSDIELAKSNILLIGPTGCGKTLLAQTLARILDVPFTMADATTLTEAGYVGEDVENIILKLLQARIQCRPRAARHRLYRRGRQDHAQVRQPLHHPRRERGGRAAGAPEDHGRHRGLRAAPGRAQASAAGIPAGRHDQHPVHLRRRLRGLDKIIAQRGKGSAIGFGADVKDKDSRGVGEMFTELEPEDLLKFGLIPEFVGRLPVIATLTDLDEDALVQILTQPKNALVKQYQRLFELEDVALTFTEDALNGHRQARDRPQDRRAGPALDHGGHPARHDVRTARRRRASKRWW